MHVWYYSFLGYVDKIGTAFEAKEVASGFGVHLAIPMIREAREKKPTLTREDAEKVKISFLLSFWGSLSVCLLFLCLSVSFSMVR